MHNITHISVCICTYNRVQLLMRLLREIESQKTESKFTFSIVIVDNDSKQSARDAVLSFSRNSSTAIQYLCEPEQNISLARNKALQHAKGEYVALIDDDEYPSDTWLLKLHDACLELSADGIQGPVIPKFEDGVPNWVIKGKLYQRPIYTRGMCLDWRQGITGNLFIKKSMLESSSCHFEPACGSGGEDKDFFKRMISEGFIFKYCPEAIVYEVIPSIRWNTSFLIKRALLRGQAAVLNPSFKISGILKSIVAVGLYTAFLPISILFGKHVFMNFLIKEFDHIGKLLSFCKLNIIKEKYITN